ncbi:MAG: molybdopterin-dependent oxidoreductase [Desulfurococcaceae archaeon]
MKVVKSVCPRDCYDTCFLNIVVENGLIKRVEPDGENPITNGFLCARGAVDHLAVYRNRVLYPYVNTSGYKPSKDFKRVSWEEAINIVAEKIEDISRNYGPDKILHLEYAGNMGLLTWYYSQRLWHALGASKTDYSICSKSGHEGISLHYGLSYGVLPEEIPNMKLIVIWGFNMAVSAPHLWRQVLLARKKGGVVITVDPRKTETARQADIWLAPRPGTDIWLAYGIAKILIERDLVDKDFIDKYTKGYEEFKKEALKYDLNEVSAITGISVGDIEKFSEIYASLKPSTIMIGLGVQKSINGAELTRVLSLLPALIGQHRGFYYTNSRGFFVDIGYLTGEKLTTKRIRTVSQVALAEYVLKGEFKFIYVYNMNPLLTLPGQRQLREGLVKNNVFVVTHTPHWNETCQFSDVVLPAPTYLEKEDIVLPYSHNYVRKSEKAIEPLGESRDETWVMHRLAERLGVKEWWVYENPLDALRKAMEKSIEGSFEELLQGKTLRLKYRLKDEYQTPSGRIEFYSSIAIEKGLNPLPTPRAELYLKDVFVLLNTASSLYTHTQFREVYGEPKPLLHINPIDAVEHGIDNDDIVEICNENECLSLIARIDHSLIRGVLWVQRQIKSLDNKPLNALIPTHTQAVGGGPVFNSTVVRINRVLKRTNQ